MPIFVIQKHGARRLHYDFRLEVDGVLKSWVVPKEPPKKKGIKRLAISVEDHALSYADFEGEVPEGRYGAGKVEIWDEGPYEMEDWEEKKLVFHLEGKKMKGRYCLVNFKYANWLLFKC